MILTRSKDRVKAKADHEGRLSMSEFRVPKYRGKPESFPALASDPHLCHQSHFVCLQRAESWIDTQFHTADRCTPSAPAPPCPLFPAASSLPAASRRQSAGWTIRAHAYKNQSPPAADAAHPDAQIKMAAP